LPGSPKIKNLLDKTEGFFIFGELLRQCQKYPNFIDEHPQNLEIFGTSLAQGQLEKPLPFEIRPILAPICLSTYPVFIQKPDAYSLSIDMRAIKFQMCLVLGILPALSLPKGGSIWRRYLDRFCRRVICFFQMISNLIILTRTLCHPAIMYDIIIL